jgi:uncharacterized protein YjbI with pentapeptide repeats
MKPIGAIHLKDMIADHRNWVLSQGKMGKSANFASWNLDEANFEFEDLSFAKFCHASLRKSNLWGACLSKAELNGADLRGAKISGADLSYSECEGANFAGAILEDVNLEGANLRKTNFTEAFLRRAKFGGSDISSSKMIDANIEGADFKGANLEATNFEGANIDDAIFEEIHREVLNIKNHLPQANFKDNTISKPLLNKTTSLEPGIKNQKSDKARLNGTFKIKSAKEDLFVDLGAVKPAIIEEAIIDLMQKLKSNIQFDQVKAICKHQHFIETIDKIDFKNGDIVTHDGQAAFKLDFNITYNLSLLLDRKGKFIDVYSSAARQKDI